MILERPEEPGRKFALTFTILVHVGLLAFLFFGVQWKRSQPDVVEVELFSSRPTPAVQAVAPPPSPPEVKPEPQPEPKPADPFDGLPGLPNHPVLNLLLPFLSKLLLGGLIMSDDSIRPHGPTEFDAGDEAALAALAALARGLRDHPAAKERLEQML